MIVHARWYPTVIIQAFVSISPNCIKPQATFILTLYLNTANTGGSVGQRARLHTPHDHIFPPYIDNPLRLSSLPLPPRVTNRANTFFCLQKRRGHGEGRGLAAMFIGTLDNIRDTKPPPFRILLHTVSPPPPLALTLSS